MTRGIGRFPTIYPCPHVPMAAAKKIEWDGDDASLLITHDPNEPALAGTPGDSDPLPPFAGYAMRLVPGGRNETQESAARREVPCGIDISARRVSKRL